MASQSDLQVAAVAPGAIAMAICAAMHGARATLFEPNEHGRNCVNRGCVPNKAMWPAESLRQGRITFAPREK